MSASTRQNFSFERQYSTSKPGFIRVKLIELDPAPTLNRSFFTHNPSSIPIASFSSSSSNSALFSGKSLVRSCTDASSSSIDPYCAVNIKELVKVDENNNNKETKGKGNNRNASSDGRESNTKTVADKKSSHTTFTLRNRK